MTRAQHTRLIKDYPVGTWREYREDLKSRTWVKQIRELRECDPYGESLSEYIKRLVAATDGLVDVDVDLEVEDGFYGDRDRDHVYVRGWRDATEAEIAEADKKRDYFNEQRDQFQRAQFERLRRERPEFFE